MRQFNVLKGTKGWVQMWERGIRFRHMRNKQEMDRRVKALSFWEKHGCAAAQDAFQVSRATLFRWKRVLAGAEGKLDALDPQSTAPKRKRRRIVPDGVEAFVIRERTEHSRLGKEKLSVLLKEDGIHISVSKVGRIIKNLKERDLLPTYTKVSLQGKTGRVTVRTAQKRRKKQRLKGFRAEAPGDLLEIDAVILIKDGTRRYILTAIDCQSDFAFAYAYTHLSSTAATDFLKKVLGVVPFQIRRIQTDNGSEFTKYFADELERLRIPHFHTYPRSPKMNAFIERFNRTIQEEHAYGHRTTLAHDIIRFNEGLVDWLVWYNTRRPHHALGLLSPMQYLVSTLGARESQRYWTNTNH